MSQVSIAEIISTQWLIPGVYNKFDPSRALRGPREMPRSLLLWGQITSPMFNPANFNKRMTVTTDAEARGLLGSGSILYQMWRGAKDNSGLGLPIRVMPLQDNSTGIANVRTITVTTSGSRGSGEQAVYIGGDRYSVGVQAADTAAQIAAKLGAALNVGDNPFTVAVNAAVITLTAKNKGTLANTIDIRTALYDSDNDVLGVTLAIAQSTAGAVDPSLSAAIVNTQNSRDTEWVVPYTDGASMALIDAEILRRWGQDVQSDVCSITALRGTEGTHTTWLASRNNPLMHSVHTVNDPTSPFVTAAMAGAAVETAASLDPAVPHEGIPLVGYKAAREEEFLQSTQINNIMLAGGSSLVVQPDGTATLMRMVTHYKTHNTGAYDESMRDLCWIKTLSWFRWFRNTLFAIRTQGFKMGEYAQPIDGQKIMTLEIAHDMLMNIYGDAVTLGRMQNPDHYEKTMLIQIDGPRGRLKIQDEPVLMTQLHQTMITSMWAAGHV